MSFFMTKIAMIANNHTRSRKTVLYSILGLFSDYEFYGKQVWAQNGHMAFLGKFLIGEKCSDFENGGYT